MTRHISKFILATFLTRVVAFPIHVGSPKLILYTSVNLKGQGIIYLLLPFWAYEVYTLIILPLAIGSPKVAETTSAATIAHTVNLIFVIKHSDKKMC